MHVSLYKILDRNPIWYSSQITYNIKLKPDYVKQVKQSRSIFALEQYKRLRIVVKQQLTIAYKDYVLNSEASIIEDPQKFCAFVHNKAGKSGIPSTVTYDDST
ncbi:oxidoreductase glyr1-related [Holotrichia oblita]|uniref:Oxidoreductase glyr1-related n=1 Tax=Holotrichia oblita TaxID=644536 RepID=A0ACB9T7X1_HOLOL|nr:oxidoreductase glyr1-related [Holotrichia oblita]